MNLWDLWDGVRLVDEAEHHTRPLGACLFSLSRSVFYHRVKFFYKIRRAKKLFIIVISLFFGFISISDSASDRKVRIVSGTEKVSMLCHSKNPLQTMQGASLTHLFSRWTPSWNSQSRERVRVFNTIDSDTHVISSYLNIKAFISLNAECVY